MTATNSLAITLPALQPEDPGARLLLFALRQMGANGLTDASAAHAFVTSFGKSFQRPLVLLRALVAEMSASSARPIQIAPWCCPRMTAGEGALLAILGRVRYNSDAALLLLDDLLGVRESLGVLATAHALANAFADLGLPLER